MTEYLDFIRGADPAAAAILLLSNIVAALWLLGRLRRAILGLLPVNHDREIRRFDRVLKEAKEIRRRLSVGDLTYKP